MRLPILILLPGLCAGAAHPVFDLARRQPPPRELRSAIEKLMPPEDIRQGRAVFTDGPDFLFAAAGERQPLLVIDGQPGPTMIRLPDAGLWFAATRLKTGVSHNFHYLADGAAAGGRTDVPAYLPESYEQPGVPKGVLSEKRTHRSRIYDGTVSDYWVYVPAQYRRGAPAALMVWQDGHGHIERNGPARTLNVIDNLIHQKKIPVMIQVFISPGMKGEVRMRSIQYDTVDDAYARFLRDEILAGLQAEFDIRRDGYSRGIAGNSSGGICAFNVAWQQPDQFSRVLSRIGSFTSIQWRPGELEGGNVYPFKVRKEPKRNIRVWLQDGAGDLENDHGSWPMQNIAMANSLKLCEYDFHFSWGNGTHNAAHGNAEAPLALAWLWRGYDTERKEQTYEMEPEERVKPFFRVAALNRE